MAGQAGLAQADEMLHLQGKHIRLTTDLPASPLVKEWVASFDAAVPLWASFWNLPESSLENWVVEAFVMKDETTFRRQNLIDPRVPPFPFAYALGNQVWIRVQPSDYYTRHLLLHEGVHSFVYQAFNGTGPTWFREGVAELLSTHQNAGQSLEINQIPTSRERVPHWGRFKRMGQIRHNKRVPRIESVMNYEPNLQGDVEAYGWSWALVSMLNAYPPYRETLHQAAVHGRDSDRQFNQWLSQRLKSQWPVVEARWRNLVEDFDYGYDWNRERIEISKRDALWDGKPIEMKVHADRGWQSIGVRLTKGMTLRIVAHGQVTIDDQPQAWISGPDGVTVEYHHGKPRGRLLARLLPNLSPQEGFLPPLTTHDLGEEATLVIDQPCWLLMRVNDAVGDLANNQSAFRVQIALPGQ